MAKKQLTHLQSGNWQVIETEFDMNKYQKIVLLIGAVILLLVFGKTITKIGFSAVALMGKGLIIIAATLLIISFLTKAGKK